MLHHKRLDIVPCAVPQDLTCILFLGGLLVKSGQELGRRKLVMVFMEAWTCDVLLATSLGS